MTIKKPYFFASGVGQHAGMDNTDQPEMPICMGQHAGIVQRITLPFPKDLGQHAGMSGAVQ